MENTKLLNGWRERIADYRTGELTMIQWCAATGYSIGQLKYWITKCNKLARKSETSGWARVEIADSGKTAASKITVHVGIARIEVERGFDRAVLGEVLRVAASIC